MSIEQLLKDREGVTAALCNFINKAEVNDTTAVAMKAFRPLQKLL